jgi:hypothetical protein
LQNLGTLPRLTVDAPEPDQRLPMHKTLWFPVCLLFLSISLVLGSNLAFAGFLIPDRQIAVSPFKPTATTTLSGRNWAYTVPFEVHNVQDIEKLIQCESQGVNIARPDSNHKISWGVLQFNGTSTWDEMELRFDYEGSPMIPGDAVHMADMMISAGFLGRWTCAHIDHLL